MNIVSGATRAARNAVGVLRGAAEGAWYWTNSKLRQLKQTSEEAKAGPEVEPEITTKPESAPTPFEAPPAKGGGTGKATAKPTPSTGAGGGAPASGAS